MYQTKHWKQLRASQLSRQPLCQSCLSRGIVNSAKHIDHVFPWSWIGKDAFYETYSNPYAMNAIAIRQAWNKMVSLSIT